jgi:ornithine cyclodeaminase
VTDNLEEAVTKADIISCATLASDPLIKGKWLLPGQHLDLVGAFRPDMREADSEAVMTSMMARSRHRTYRASSGILLRKMPAGAHRTNRSHYSSRLALQWKIWLPQNWC